MESPLCLSQGFVNKQNVRSFGNIVRASLLKKEDMQFASEVFSEQKLLLCESTPKIIPFLSTLKRNLREKCKQDFRNYFPTIGESGKRSLQEVDKQTVLAGCWKALQDVIPREFCGNNHNTKILKSFLTTVVYTMRGQHYMLSKLFEKWDFTTSQWNKFSEATSSEILNAMILWILKNIISPIICLSFYATTCKLNADEYKLYFFWKNDWQSFYDTQISRMIVSNVMCVSKSRCVTKKCRKHRTLNERLKFKAFKKETPKLYLILKNNNGFRPIVKYKNDPPNPSEKRKVKDRLILLKGLIGKPQMKIESEYYRLHENWIKLGRPKLYFVKADLTNAFGSINKEKLMKILAERHIKMQQTEKNLQAKRKIAQVYSDFLGELRTPLLIRAGSTVYEWKRGLVQGYKYSPALSELYYSYMDKQYFSELLTKCDAQIKFFTRVVDDYLFVTDSLDVARAFLEALSNYRNVNYDKTVVNFEHSTIQRSNEITFLGYSYDTTSLQVSRAKNVYAGQMCYKIAFSSAVSNLYKFLENRIGQSGIQINRLIFNFHWNTEELVWRHTFTTFCLSANKFCTILSIQCTEDEMANYLTLYKKRVTVKLSNAILETLSKDKPQDVTFMYCINHFRYLSWKALLLCAQGTSKCNGLVPLICVELAKSNCIFGKWREHASRISSDGVCCHNAVRQVCARPDLRVVFKSFDKLPEDFQSYRPIRRNCSV